MSLTPLGHRVLIRPDEQPTESEGGIVLPEDRHHVSMSGTVVAVGRGSAQLAQAREKTARKCLQFVQDEKAADAIRKLIQAFHALDPTQTVSVGDRVAYPVDAGLTLTENGQQYIIMNEDDVVVLVEESAGV